MLTVILSAFSVILSAAKNLLLVVIPSAAAVILSEAKNLLFALSPRESRWALCTAVIVVAVLVAVLRHRREAAPLPGPLAARVQALAVQSAVDSTEIRHLKRHAAAASNRSRAAIAHARMAASVGAYQQAYQFQDTALAALQRQASELGLALTKSESRAIVADGLVADMMPIIQGRDDPCRVLWVIPCPSRSAVGVAAAALTAAAIVAAPKVAR